MCSRTVTATAATRLGYLRMRGSCISRPRHGCKPRRERSGLSEDIEHLGKFDELRFHRINPATCIANNAGRVFPGFAVVRNMFCEFSGLARRGRRQKSPPRLGIGDQHGLIGLKPRHCAGLRPCSRPVAASAGRAHIETRPPATRSDQRSHPDFRQPRRRDHRCRRW